MKTRRASILGAVLVAILATSCLGPNHATANLWNWNANFENKWAREGVFILALPAYVIFSVGDQLIFNSMYWWTGDNPIDPPSREDAAGTFGA